MWRARCKARPSVRITSAPAPPLPMNETPTHDDDAMQPEYDFSDAVANPYAQRYAPGVNVVKLDPDVAAAFPDAEAVNRALRACLEVAATVKRAG